MRKKQYTLFLFALALSAATAHAQNSSPYWSLAGNSNATTSSKLGTTNGVSLRFYANNVQRMVIAYTTGNLGIGTSTLPSRLTVNAPSGSSVFSGQVNGTTKLFAASNGGLSIGSGSTPPSNGLYVSGRVGIGTTSPSTNLHVVGSGRFTKALTVESGGVSVTNFEDEENPDGAVHNGISVRATATGIISYGEAYGVQTSGDGMGLKATGLDYESIGVLAKGEGYGVQADGGFATGVYGQGETFGVYGQSRAKGVYGASDTGYGVYGYSAGTSVAGAGKTGVYGYCNSYGYGVVGYSRNGSGVLGSGGTWAGYFSGSVYTTGTYQSSDRKLKQNIEALSSALDVINQLQPKQYEFKQDAAYQLMNLPKGKHYGLIAQDVETVLPDLVKETSFDTRLAQPQAKALPGKSGETNASASAEVVSFKAVNYTELIPIVIKGMQELNAKTAEIESLKREVAELRQLVLDLKRGTSGATVTAATLAQNVPNPARAVTTIRYQVPQTAGSASLVVTNAKGQVVKSITVSNRGAGQVDLNTLGLAAGAYNYTLYVDSQATETKRLVVAR